MGHIGMFYRDFSLCLTEELTMLHFGQLTTNRSQNTNAVGWEDAAPLSAPLHANDSKCLGGAKFTTSTLRPRYN